MKKRLVICFLIVITLFLAGCKTGGKAIQMPPNINQPGFGIERSVNSNTVTLIIYQQALPSNEILIIAEKIPNGVSYVSGSASISPESNDNSVLIWLFAKNAPQYLGATRVGRSIPNTITYRVSQSAAPNGFIGRWGLVTLNMEGVTQSLSCQPNCANKLCGYDGCGGSCGTCSVGYTCTNGQCRSGSGGVSIMDVLNAITQYKSGSMTILQLLNVIEQYKQGL